MSRGVGERKVRSDKKVDVKATMSLTLKRQLYEFADLCEEPVKDIAERLCMLGAESKCIMDEICKWMRRNYYYKNTIVMGYSERPRLKLTFQDETGTVTIRFVKYDYDKLCELAYALDLTPSSTATVLIRMTLKNIEFMDEFMNTLHVGENQKEKVNRYLRKIWGFK